MNYNDLLKLYKADVARGYRGDMLTLALEIITNNAEYTKELEDKYDKVLDIVYQGKGLTLKQVKKQLSDHELVRWFRNKQ